MWSFTSRAADHRGANGTSPLALSNNSRLNLDPWAAASQIERLHPSFPRLIDMRHTFNAEQWLPFSPELVFAFFANPENLPRLMPPWQKAGIEEAAFAPPPPRPPTSLPQRGIAAGAGTRLTLSFRPFPLSPIRVPWEAEISEFAWNDHFCDTQLRGPFKYWKHCHHIRPESRELQPGAPPTPGSLLSDHVDYELPLGAIGDLGNLVLMRRQLKSTFAYRHRRTADLLPMAASR